MEEKDWPDSSLGCPQPGMAYLQVITPGYLIVLRALGNDYMYHASYNYVILCQAFWPIKPIPPTPPPPPIIPTPPVVTIEPIPFPSLPKAPVPPVIPTVSPAPATDPYELILEQSNRVEQEGELDAVEKQKETHYITIEKLHEGQITDRSPNLLPNAPKFPETPVFSGHQNLAIQPSRLLEIVETFAQRVGDMLAQLFT
jgi:hypothetical protein